MPIGAIPSSARTPHCSMAVISTPPHSPWPRSSMQRPSILPRHHLSILHPIRTTPTTAYVFVAAFPAGHFVSDWIAHFSAQCDAPREFHEAAALVALAQATPSLTARLSGSASGLRTNLFVLFVGKPSAPRKSTAAAYAVEATRRAAIAGILPELASQEGFVESLTFCNNGAALWFVDEFTDMLAKLTQATHL